MVNMLFWFIMKPTGDSDPVKTIVTRSVYSYCPEELFYLLSFDSMATVLTASMTLRIILSVRGSLNMGGSFALSTSGGESSRSTEITSGRSGNLINGSAQPNTFTLDDLRTKPEGEWAVPDNKSSVNIADRKNNNLVPDSIEPSETMAVKVTIDRDTK
jgi:hypothetical protein